MTEETCEQDASGLIRRMIPLYSPPETIRQECWNVGLLLTLAVLVPLSPLLYFAKPQQAIAVGLVYAIPLIGFVGMYHERHKGAY
jgi:hypothetical protein